MGGGLSFFEEPFHGSIKVRHAVNHGVAVASFEMRLWRILSPIGDIHLSPQHRCGNLYIM